MKRILLSAFPLLVASGLMAQAWCPPGATWTYSHSNGWTYDGMAQYRYIGDTIIAGSTAQVITLETEGHNWPENEVVATSGDRFYTRVEGDRVDLWNGSAFSTLYDFAAEPGDQWQLSTPDGSSPSARWITIQETGQLDVDGVTLRYLVTNTSDTIIERLGSLPYQFVPWALEMLDAPNGLLRCYEDAEINYQSPHWSFDCRSIAQVPELEGTGFGIAPNPGSDHFELVTAPGTHTVELFDPTGRKLWAQQTSTGRTRFNTVDLPSGAYLIRIDGDTPLRWVKQ